MQTPEGFNSWAIVEVMGHNVFAGHATEATIGGTSFLRVDVPAHGDQSAFTKYLGTGSIFSITPCDEATAVAMCRRKQIRPFDEWTVRELAADLASRQAKGLPSPEPTLFDDEDFESDGDSGEMIG